MKFDTKELKTNIKLMVVPLVILTVLVLIPITLSRYIGTSFATGTGITAIPIFEYNAEGTNPISLSLDDIKPGDSNTYNFAVKNTDGTGVTETALNYDLTIITTNNIPLTFTLSRTGMTTITKMVNGNGTSDSLTTAGTFPVTTSTTHTYTLTIAWAGSNNNYNNSYEMDVIDINIDWEQKIS